MTRARDIRKSDFSAVTSVQSGDYFDIVRSGQNFRISWADLVASIAAEISSDVPLGLAVNSGATITIAAADTPVVIGSGWTSQIADQFTITAAGRFTYTGEGAYIKIDASISSYVGVGDDNFSLFVAVNGTFVAASQITHRSVGVLCNTKVVWAGELSTNDYIEFFVQNDDTDEDIIIDNIVARLN